MNAPLKPWHLMVLFPLGLVSALVSMASVAVLLQAVWDRVPSSEISGDREGQVRKGHQAASDCLRFLIENDLRPPSESMPIPDSPGLDAEQWLWRQRVAHCTEWSTISRLIGQD